MAIPGFVCGLDIFRERYMYCHKSIHTFIKETKVGERGLKCKARMTLFQRLGVAEISTFWPFRYPLLVKMSISIASHAGIQKIFSGGEGAFRPGVVQQILPLQKPIFWKIEGGGGRADPISTLWIRPFFIPKTIREWNDPP